MKKEPTDIEVSGLYCAISLSVACNYDGARYHFWVRSDNLQPINFLLYKNPLDPKLKSTDPGYFEPRKLDQRKGVGLKIVPAMMAALPEGARKVKQEWQEEAIRREQSSSRYEAAERIRKAAPAMLAALQDISKSEDPEYMRGVARDAIKDLI